MPQYESWHQTNGNICRLLHSMYVHLYSDYAFRDFVDVAWSKRDIIIYHHLSYRIPFAVVHLKKRERSIEWLHQQEMKIALSSGSILRRLNSSAFWCHDKAKEERVGGKSDKEEKELNQVRRRREGSSLSTWIWGLVHKTLWSVWRWMQFDIPAQAV